VEYQFKPGNRANPKGRGKKNRNRKIVISEVLFEPVKVNEGGVEKQMPALEVVLKRLLSLALKGDLKAALTVLGIGQRKGLLTPEQVDALLAETDIVLSRVVRRQSRGKSKTIPTAPGNHS
jgi:hypothetical protein